MLQILDIEFKNSKKTKYSIEISDSKLEDLVDSIEEFTKGKRRLVVISKKVYKLYRKIFNFKKNEVFILNDGEKEKNFKNYLKILEKATKLNLTRGDIFVAIGGGVVGDITGYAASTYMRGIDYVQVPTTLLAMADSSVGGKTAIDLPYAKNVIGTFWQPKSVFINVNFLMTLDKKQFMSGLGEVLKYAFIEKSCECEKEFYFFEYLTLCSDKFLQKDLVTLIRVIHNCLMLKSSVVSKDEKEKGLRKILNFGHTFAHAIETKTNYRKYTHGEAVIYGIFFILEWAYKNNYITLSYYRLSLELLTKYGFKPLRKKFKAEEMLDLFKRDKKAGLDKIVFIVPNDKKSVKEAELSVNDVLKMF